MAIYNINPFGLDNQPSNDPVLDIAGTSRIWTAGNGFAQNYININNALYDGKADTIYVDFTFLEDSPWDSPFFVNGNLWFYGNSLDEIVFQLPDGYSLVDSYFNGFNYLDITDRYGYSASNSAKFIFIGDPGYRAENICFAAGTRLLGEDNTWRAVEDLKEGDLVMTKDDGLQPVKWVGSSPVGREVLEQFPNRRPIVFEPGAIGNTERLVVSQQHRMLVKGAQDVGPEQERLVAAKHLVNDTTIYVDNSCDPVEYYHVMCDRHQVVMSDGAWSETFWPGVYIRKYMAPETWSQVEFHFPELATETDAVVAYSEPARRFVKRREVKEFLNPKAIAAA